MIIAMISHRFCYKIKMKHNYVLCHTEKELSLLSPVNLQKVTCNARNFKIFKELAI